MYCSFFDKEVKENENCLISANCNNCVECFASKKEYEEEKEK